MKNTDFNLNIWIKTLKQKILSEFKERVLFIGLQGSYARHEETAKSDVDTVVILDNVDIEDLENYKKIINSMNFKEKACGFISGEKEIKNWSKSDLFQFVYDTKPLYGNLKDFCSIPKKTDIEKSVKTSAETLYHNACNSFVFDTDITKNLPSLYKMTFFILQAKYFLETETYISTKAELLKHLCDKDKEILEICINKNFTDKKTAKFLYKKLLDWCKKFII